MSANAKSETTSSPPALEHNNSGVQGKLVKAYLVSVTDAEHTLELAAALLDEGVKPEDLSVVVDESYAARISGAGNGSAPRLESDLVTDPSSTEDLTFASTGELEMERSYEAADNREGILYESEIGGGISTASFDDSVSGIDEMDSSQEMAEETLHPLGDFDARTAASGPDADLEETPGSNDPKSSPTGIHGQEAGLSVGVLAALIPAVVPGLGLVMGDGPLASDLLAEEDKAIEKGILPFLEAQGLEEPDATRFGAILASGGGILEVSAASGEASHRQILDVLESQNHSRYLIVDIE